MTHDKKRRIRIGMVVNLFHPQDLQQAIYHHHVVESESFRCVVPMFLGNYGRYNNLKGFDLLPGAVELIKKKRIQQDIGIPSKGFAIDVQSY